MSTEYSTCFGPATSFILGLLVILLHSSQEHLQTLGLIFWCHAFLAFYTVHEVLTAGVLQSVQLLSRVRLFAYCGG